MRLPQLMSAFVTTLETSGRRYTRTGDGEDYNLTEGSCARAAANTKASGRCSKPCRQPNNRNVAKILAAEANNNYQESLNYL